MLSGILSVYYCCMMPGRCLPRPLLQPPASYANPQLGLCHPYVCVAIVWCSSRHRMRRSFSTLTTTALLLAAACTACGASAEVGDGPVPVPAGGPLEMASSATAPPLATPFSIKRAATEQAEQAPGHADDVLPPPAAIPAPTETPPGAWPPAFLEYHA